MFLHHVIHVYRLIAELDPEILCEECLLKSPQPPHPTRVYDFGEDLKEVQFYVTSRLKFCIKDQDSLGFLIGATHESNSFAPYLLLMWLSRDAYCVDLD